MLGVSRDRVDATLERVGLVDVAGRLVGRLSGGQRARVSLATALLNDPEVLVLDEPTVGLDPVLRRDLWDFFHELAAGGTTLLVSSHVMDEAARCDRLLLLRDGAILADLTPARAPSPAPVRPISTPRSCGSSKAWGREDEPSPAPPPPRRACCRSSAATRARSRSSSPCPAS